MEWKRFTVKLVTEEPFRIGALENPISGIHNPVTTIGGQVVVQGASLKGALRHELENYLIERHAGDQWLKPCIPTSERLLSEGERALIRAGKYKPGGNCQYREEVQRRGAPAPRSLGNHEYICPACYLFGAQGLTGFARVPYLFTNARAEELYAVRIDRATTTVAEGTNRDYQILPPGTVFTGTLDVLVHDPVRGWEFGKKRALPTSATLGDKWLEDTGWNAQRLWKELLLARLQAITLLGGFKSRGCGRVSITVDPAVL
jgi:CRISPR/Cas system CSM-associated protein Csm3 (group 7 of RAMP superfamily)